MTKATVSPQDGWITGIGAYDLGCFRMIFPLFRPAAVLEKGERQKHFQFIHRIFLNPASKHDIIKFAMKFLKMYLSLSCV